jgi:hypothetical protein
MHWYKRAQEDYQDDMLDIMGEMAWEGFRERMINLLVSKTEAAVKVDKETVAEMERCFDAAWDIKTWRSVHLSTISGWLEMARCNFVNLIKSRENGSTQVKK